MADNFNFKQFLVENRLGAYAKVSRLSERVEDYDVKGMQADLDAMPKGDEDDAPMDEPAPQYKTYADVVNAIAKKYGYRVYHDEIEEFMRDKDSLRAILAGKDPIKAYEEFYNIQRESQEVQEGGSSTAHMMARQAMESGASPEEAAEELEASGIDPIKAKMVVNSVYGEDLTGDFEMGDDDYAGDNPFNSMYEDTLKVDKNGATVAEDKEDPGVDQDDPYHVGGQMQGGLFQEDELEEYGMDDAIYGRGDDDDYDRRRDAESSGVRYVPFRGGQQRSFTPRAVHPTTSFLNQVAAKVTDQEMAAATSPATLLKIVKDKGIAVDRDKAKAILAKFWYGKGKK